MRGRTRNQRTSGDHVNYGIVRIGPNTVKSPGDWRRLALTLDPVKYQQLWLMWKTRIIIITVDNWTLKKFWHMKLTRVLIKYGDHRTISKNLDNWLMKKEIWWRFETFQTRLLMRFVRILIYVQERLTDSLSLRMAFLLLMLGTN